MDKKDFVVPLFVFDFASIEFNLREVKWEGDDMTGPGAHEMFIESGEMLHKWLYSYSHTTVYETLFLKMLESQFDENKTIKQLKRELSGSFKMRG